MAAAAQRLESVKNSEAHEDSPAKCVSQSIDRGALRARRRRNLPQEEAKGNGSLQGRAVRAVTVGSANGDGEGHGAGEPEKGSQGVKNEGSQLVEPARHVDGGDADVGQHQQRPDRVEEHEVDAVGGAAAVGAPAPPSLVEAHDYVWGTLAFQHLMKKRGNNKGQLKAGGFSKRTIACETELDDGEDGRDGVDDGKESESHGGGDDDVLCAVWFLWWYLLVRVIWTTSE